CPSDERTSASMALFKLGNVEDFYELGEVLGSGHFGQVRRVCERATGQHYAAKFLKVFKSTRSLHGLDRSQVEPRCTLRPEGTPSQSPYQI
uniref:Protein kinase domain-containing protein n=1 Tax=Periophthalmus magnuspinnatus TaxID=409849 RepID=A0A3B3ZV98_9GOBI